ncbi:MAG: hypothetical protein FWH35_01220 [Treponema sp.]|nr:hypothetical protein [Treponema sp.]
MKKQIKFSNRVKILPYVGEKYFEISPKVLILGESAFGDHEGDRKLLQNVINAIKNGIDNKYTEHAKTKSFYTKVMNLISDISDDNKLSFWNNVCFYDFIQVLLDGPSVIPPKEYFTNAEEPFFEIMEKLEPDLIIVLGQRLYKKLPYKEGGEECKPFSENGIIMPIYKYKINKKSVYCCGINHPTGSHGFKKDIWKILIKKFRKIYE